METELRKISPDELEAILAAHKKWRRGEAGGVRADLSRADLAGADLAGADLARANLAGANLAGADLAGADLAGADLAGADLAGADLAGADLARANLARADLADADLAGADLARADLAGANLAGANLAGANLAGANLARANLARADLADADLADANLARANLADADLADAYRSEGDQLEPREPYVRGKIPDYAARAAHFRERNPDVPVVDGLDRKILDVVTKGDGRLEMATWHTCDTTHCRGGWAVTLAGEAGKKLEKKYDTRRAASMIYRASTGRVPHFFATNEQAMADIRRCAGITE